MHAVYLALNLQEAELFKQRLLQEGIEAVVRNDHLQGALGELPLTCRPEVCVFREADVAPARAHVRSMEAAQRVEPQDDVICGHCGESNPHNFETCWSCRRELQ